MPWVGGATVDLKVITREFLGPIDLPGAQTFCIHKLAEVVVVNEYKHLVLISF